MKNEQLTISEINLPADKEEIMSWETNFANSKGMTAIEQFVLEYRLIRDLGELIETNYERYPIGDNEMKKMFVLRNKSNKIVAFSVVDTFKFEGSAPEAFLQYMVVHPQLQHKGYGSILFDEIMTILKNFYPNENINFFTYIDKRNTASKSFFEKKGFSIRALNDPNFEKAWSDSRLIEQAKITQKNLE